MNTPYFPIPDVQNFADERNLDIDQVGIKSIRHPVSIVGSTGEKQSSIAVFDMYVGLPSTVKGTHMSRFVEALGDKPLEIGIRSIAGTLAGMAERLEATSGRLEIRFPYFIAKAAPVSGVRSLLDYEVTLIAFLKDGRTATSLRVLVPVTSLCPCSKTISERGAHNQRSHVTVTTDVNGDIAIDELVSLIEQQASCELYGLLKRADEKYVTERAYDNPKFVEDLVRDVAVQLNKEPRIGKYTVEAENFESIHNHSAYARIDRAPAA